MSYAAAIVLFFSSIFAPAPDAETEGTGGGVILESKGTGGGVIINKK